MIDAVPPSPQQVVQKMVECGIDRAGIVVEADGGSTGIVVRVRREARAPVDRIGCIHQATDTALVIFEDQVVQDAYDGYALDQSRPAMLASARAELARLGLIERFPRRAAYADMPGYVRALERHGGVAAGSMLRVSGNDVLVDYRNGSETMAGFGHLTTVMAVLMYATAIGDLDRIGFAAVAPAAR